MKTENLISAFTLKKEGCCIKLFQITGIDENVTLSGKKPS